MFPAGLTDDLLPEQPEAARHEGADVGQAQQRHGDADDGVDYGHHAAQRRLRRQVAVAWGHEVSVLGSTGWLQHGSVGYGSTHRCQNTVSTYRFQVRTNTEVLEYGQMTRVKLRSTDMCQI